MSVELTRERIEALIAAEDDAHERVTSFIQQGVAAGRISRISAAYLLDAARRQHDGNVRRLRDLLDGAPQ